MYTDQLSGSHGEYSTHLFESPPTNGENQLNMSGHMSHTSTPHHSLNPFAASFVNSSPVTSSLTENSLASALATAMERNRLPVPTPQIFSGNPMEFISFKRSFKTLIEGRGISAEEKIYYLQQYLTSEAREAVSGCFYGTNESDYLKAWQILERRFGHSFQIQEAFRKKLDNWNKIGPKDSNGLQRFSDFLRNCLDATPHISELQVLNDCKENQRLASKLPDWAISRWSRIVVDSIENGGYPSFERFVDFVEREARAACHPIASIQAIRNAMSEPVKSPHVEHKAIRNLFVECSKQEQSAQPSHVMTHESCPYCNETHSIVNCVKFSELSLSDRNSFIKRTHRCFGCLRTGHSFKQCKVRHTCRVCKGRHPTLLHDENRRKSTSSNSNANQSVTTLNLYTSNNQAGTTNIIPVWISSSRNSQIEILAYALLDTQSDSSFIEDSICEQLNTDSSSVQLQINTLLDQNETVSCRKVVGLRVRGYTSAQYIELPPTYSRDCIPLDRSHIPTCDTARQWPHLSHLSSQMPPLLNCTACILIGYNCAPALAPRQVILGDQDQPYAIRTDLGWSIVSSSAVSDNHSYCHRIHCRESAAPLDALKILESDFKDNIDSNVSISQNDVKFLQKLGDNIQMNDSGHLEMPLPFKHNPVMTNNYPLAIRRLSYLQNRFNRDPEYCQKYTDFIDTMLRDGHAEPAPETPVSGKVNYIPHHGVVQGKHPEKLRVVFDCSARYQGSSLNDQLLSGPDMTNNLIGVLLRFRRYPVAVTCDIEKMFYQFHVSPNDRDFLRFLWWKDGDMNYTPQEYRMKVHLFGATSSPGCANYGLRYLAQSMVEEFPLATQFIQQNFYVDDGITSVATTTEALQLIEETRNLCSRGKLRLHKFASNDCSVVKSIPTADLACQTSPVNLKKEEFSSTLGLQWNPRSDTFNFTSLPGEYNNTRRGILSAVASIYDPLGLIAPFLLEGKRILQDACRKGVDWDEEVNDDLVARWERWKLDSDNLRQIQIPRCYVTFPLHERFKFELHHFSDASTVGYGACSYLRYLSDNQIHCSLVASKTRVAPIKIVTIPRLELTAATTAVMLSKMLKEELQLEFEKEYFWCDSKIVLAYINNDIKRFNVFVANRIQLIKNNSDVKQWSYISTSENPADHASRGLTTSELTSSNWLRGPDFLWSLDPLVTSLPSSNLQPDDPEVKATALRVEVTEIDYDDLLSTFSRYSDWSFLCRVIARILRLTNNSVTGTDPINADELMNAGLRIIKLVQLKHFSSEIDSLRKGGNVPRNSSLYNLNPVLEDGIIRLKGRIKGSLMPLGQKCPIALPRKDHVTTIIVAHCHEEVCHQGRGQTLNFIRSNGYWIIKGTSLVSTYIYKCVFCRRLRRPMEEQKMADLPAERVQPSPPFSFCGMDCFGPFVVKRGRKDYKRYGLLFTCLYSRAVHIEMLEDMSSDSFIIALRNFIALRGAVTEIRSDRGSNFIGASNEFQVALKELDVDRITTFLTKKQCRFVFNVPHASHTGGVWERQIRSVRNVLYYTVSLASDRLDDTSLRCLFYEAMAIVNSRPLSPPDSSDPTEEVLTPNHLITMKPNQPLPPPGHFVKQDVYVRKRWRRIQFLAEQFWHKWKAEYLSDLNVRQKWNTANRNMKPGDVVILVKEDTNRCEWPIALVQEAPEDGDGLVRRVKLRLGNPSLNSKGKPNSPPSIIERPIQKVVLLIENSD